MDDIWTRAERWLRNGRGPADDHMAYQTICSISRSLFGANWEYCMQNLGKIKQSTKKR